MSEQESNVPVVNKGQTDVTVPKEEFTRRFAERFYDPAFGDVRSDIEKISSVAYDGLLDMHLVEAGRAVVHRYVGYMEDYCASHDALDSDPDVQEELRNVAREVVATGQDDARRKYDDPVAGLQDPRPK